MIFFETFWANSSGGLEGLETFFWICSPLHHLSSFSSLLFFISPLLFTCLASSLFLSSLFSSLDHLLSCLEPFLSSSRVSSLLFHLLLSFLVSPLSSSRFSLFIFSFLLFYCLVFSFLFLSCLLFSFLVLSSLFFSLSVSLCLSLFLSVSVSVSLCLSPCGVVCCGAVCVTVCTFKNASVCTFKTPPCVRSKRLRVYRHHARMCYHMRAWCRYTRGRFERTHGGFWDGHTEEKGGKEGEGSGVTVSSANHETAHVELSRALERFTVRNPWFLPIQGLRTSREQHVPESSNHSLYLMKLLSSIIILRDTAEGISTHNTQIRTNTHSPTHPPPLPSPPLPPPLPPPPTRTRKRTCTCTCICVCVFLHM